MPALTTLFIAGLLSWR